MEDTELVRYEEQGLIRPAGTPKDLVEAIRTYKEIQNALDKAMPDCIMILGGKKFRKKNYWRGIKTAFNLKVECLSESKITHEDGDWGYHVIYRATATNGATADGDGACTFSEKSKGSMQASDHNIRSQAHTRAFNRAVSNLVGFGEVSAEEINKNDIAQNEPIRQPQPKPKSEIKPETPSVGTETIITGIEKVTEVHGTKNNKPWTKYTIHADKEYNTFSKTIADDAKKASEAGLQAVIELRKTAYGYDVVALKIQEPENQPIAGG